MIYERYCNISKSPHNFLMFFRDIKDTTVGTLSQRITRQLMGVRGLYSQIQDIHSYLEQVASGRLPINHEIVYQLQDIFNLLPDVLQKEYVSAVYVKTNDQMLVVYLASLIRSVIALHNLISNKLNNKDAEKSDGKKIEDKKEKKTDKNEKEKNKENLKTDKAKKEKTKK